MDWPEPQRHWSPSRNRGQVERVSEGVYRGLLEGVSGCGGWSIPVDSGRWRAQAGGESVVQPDIQWSIQTSVVPLGRSSSGPVVEFVTSLLDDELGQRDELERSCEATRGLYVKRQGLQRAGAHRSPRMKAVDKTDGERLKGPRERRSGSPAWERPPPESARREPRGACERVCRRNGGSSRRPRADRQSRRPGARRARAPTKP